MAVVLDIAKKITHPASAVETSGARTLQVMTRIQKAAGDSNNSIYFIAEVPDQAVIKTISLEGAAVTGMNDADVGLWDVDGNVIDKDCFADGMDLSSVSGLPLGPLGQGIRQCMSAVGIANGLKKVFEIAQHVNKAFPGAGETNRKSKYRIGLQLNTASANAGDFIARVEYMIAV